MATTVTLTLNVVDADVDELVKKLESTGTSIEKVKSKVKSAAKETQALGDKSEVISKLDSITGGWASKITGVVDGLKGVVKGLNLSKAALIATGIGAFVVALSLIVTYWDDIVESVTGVNIELEKQKSLSDQINLYLERRNQLEKDNARYVDARTKERLLRAKVAGASESELTNIRRDGLKERLALAQEYADKADEILNSSVDADDEAYSKALKNQIDAYDELAKAQTALGFFDLEQQIPDSGSGASGGNKRERERKVNPITGEILEDEIERLSIHYSEIFELDKINKEALKTSADGAIEGFMTSEELAQVRRNQIEKQGAGYRTAIAEQEAQAKSAAFMVAADAFSAASELIGKETAVGKGLAIASALIATYQSAVNSYNSLSAIPIAGPILGAVAAAAAVASGLAQVKAIASVKVPGQSGGSGASVSTPPAFNVVQNNPQNQLNQSLLEQNDEPVQAFVVDKDITTAQEARRNKIDSSSL